MAHCCFGFGRWFAQGVVCSAVLLAMVGCGGSGKDGHAGAGDSGSRAENVSVPATRINATKGAVVSGSSQKPPAPLVPSQDSNSTSATATAGVADKLVVTGKVTSADGSDFGTTVVVSVLSSNRQGEGRPPFETTTTTLGFGQTYRIEVAPPTSGEVIAGAKGFLMQAFSLVPQYSAQPLTAGVITQDFVLIRGAEISGRLVGADGAPLSGSVQANSPKNDGSSSIGVVAHERSTEKDGFSITVPKGEVKLQARAKGYATAWRTFTAPAKGVEIRMGEGATIEGRVLLLATGQGVSSASVSLQRKDPEIGESASSAIADSSGHFRINGVSDGTYQCYPNAPDLFPAQGGKGSAEVTVTSGVANLKPELFLFPGYTISGRVTDEELGTPIEGVKVSQRGPKEVSALTDSDGRYKLFPVVMDGLIVKKDGWVMGGADADNKSFNPFSVESRMTVPLGEKLDVTHDFTMEEELTVSGKVTLANGDAVPGAEVMILSQRQYGHRKNKTMADGGYRVGISRNNSIIVKATAPGYAVSYSDLLEVGETPVSNVNLIMNLGVTLSGVVVDPKGKPAPGAEVKAILHVTFANYGWEDWTAKALADADGLFTLTDVPPNDVLLKANKEGFAQSERITVSAGSGEARKDIKLKLRTSHFIAGRVMDARRNPISGAKLSFNGSSGSYGSAISDVDGKYRTDNLPPDTYRGSCQVEKPVHISMSVEEIEVDRADVDFVMEEVKKKEILHPVVTVICKVLDTKTRQPVTSFEVTPKQPSLATDPALPGQFSFRANLYTNYPITIKAEGYSPELESIVVERDLPDPKVIEILLGRGASVIGRVVTKADKSPIEGLQLALAPSSPNQSPPPRNLQAATRWATSQADGQFVFQQVTGEDYILEVKASEGREAVFKAIKVDAHKVNDLGNIEVGTGGTVRVTVTSQSDQQSVEGLTVDVSYVSRTPNTASPKWNLKGKTDSNGVAEIKNVPAGPYWVILDKTGMLLNTEIKDGEVVDLSMDLGGGTLKGKITFEGKPIVRAMLFVRPTGLGWEKRSSYRGQTNTDGLYEIPSLSAGAYEVSVDYFVQGSKLDYSIQAWEKLDITGNGEQVQDFNLASGRIAGTVVDAEGKPVEEAYVFVTATAPAKPSRSGTEIKRVRSGSKGEFAARGLEGGTYSVYAAKYTYRNSTKQTLELPPNGQASPITLQLLPVEQ